MTCGIYALSFEGTDQVYIGQSINIERRFGAHLTSLKSYTQQSCPNYKLFNSYVKYGKPSLNVLELCSEVDLDKLEMCYIEEFDSVNNGLNMTFGGSSSGSGVTSSRSKYSREEILEVFNLLCEFKLTLQQISDATGMPRPSVSNISLLKIHHWLEEEFPEKMCTYEK